MPENRQVLRPSSLTDRLAEEVRAAVAETPPHSANTVLSERKLAELHGVSRTTVRRALKKLMEDGYLVSRPRRGYQVAAGGGEGRGKDLIALVRRKASRPWEWTEFQIKLLSGFQQAAAEAGKDLLLLGREGSDPAELGRHMAEREVTGAFVDCDDPGFARALGGAGVSVVMVDAADPEIESVTQDNFGGAYRATAHLISRGHRRIAGLVLNAGRNPDAVHYIERVGGYLAALSRAGLAAPAEWLITSPPVEAPGKTLAELARHPGGPQAAVVLWSEMLEDIGEALLASGARPELCVWWGGTPEARENWCSQFPGLAVPDGVEWEVADLARRALGRLEALRRAPGQPPARTLVPLRLVAGSSKQEVRP